MTTKYVYGRGLIGEETNNSFKTYHFDYRGSTVALTNINGTITDTFEYDTYGKLISRTGSTKILFMYNGRDGVVTDDNGLIYMRARYYSPELRRFVNADIIAGEITNAITLNRYAYANANPVSFVDPFGLSADARENSSNGKPSYKGYENLILKGLQKSQEGISSRYGSDKYKNQIMSEYKDAYDKIVEALKSGELPTDFIEGVKVQIIVDLKYNNAARELLEQLVGLIPYLGELYDLADYFSDEKHDSKNILEILYSLITEKEVAEAIGINGIAKFLSGIGTAKDFAEIIKTLRNLDSEENFCNYICICIDLPSAECSYRYEAIFDENLKFKQLYANLSASKIDGDPFQFILKQ